VLANVIHLQSNLLFRGKSGSQRLVEFHRGFTSVSSGLACKYKTRLAVRPNEEPLRCPTLGEAHGLAHKQKTTRPRLARDKRYSLLQKFVNYRPLRIFVISYRQRKVLQHWLSGLNIIKLFTVEIYKFS
jgi:hypothetical protein